METAIIYGKGGTMVTGDAIDLFRVKSIQLAVKSANRGMMLTRGMTMKRSLELASSITQKQYKGKKDAEKAINDLQLWLDAFKATIPIIDEREV